jgi:hypothetical protein
MGSKVHDNAGRRSDEKIALVTASKGLSGENLGEFLRKHGVHSSELDLWSDQMRDGLEAEVVVTTESKKYFRDKIKKLERELKEAQLIIEAQKKVQSLMEGEDKNSLSKSKKKSSK